MAVIVSVATQNQPKSYAYALTATSPPWSQQSAFIVPATVNVFTTVPPGSACELPLPQGNIVEIEIINRGGQFGLTVLPPPGWEILPNVGGNTVNGGVLIPNGGWAKFLSGDPNAIGNIPVWYAHS